MAKILIINAHPDPDRKHFCHALADAYAEAAKGRHKVRRIDLAKLDFPLLRSPEDWLHGKAPASLSSARAAIRWAEHLVFIYPLWLGDMPALLKAFLEQIARPGFAIGMAGRGLPEKLLKGRSARIVVTMGMPGWFYGFVYRAHSLKSLERNILRFAGIGPVRHSIVGSIESGAAHREKWLATMRRLGRRGT